MIDQLTHADMATPKLGGMMTDDELLYGLPGVEYRGLLPMTQQARVSPWPDTMTRQRRRAIERDAARAPRR